VALQVFYGIELPAMENDTPPYFNQTLLVQSLKNTKNV